MLSTLILPVEMRWIRPLPGNWSSRIQAISPLIANEAFPHGWLPGPPIVMPGPSWRKWMLRLAISTCLHGMYWAAIVAQPAWDAVPSRPC